MIYSWTHDSIGLGEDGPTHQPVEHLASLRAMPGLTLVRPADANETAQAWRLAVESDGPVGLVLTRQDVPVLAETAARAAAGVARGGYVLAEADGRAEHRADRHRERGAAVPGCGHAAGRRRRGRLGWSRCRAGSGSRSRTRGTVPRSCRPACRPSAWRRARRSAGAAMPTPRWGWTASGHRRPGAVAMERFGVHG